MEGLKNKLGWMLILKTDRLVWSNSLFGKNKKINLTLLSVNFIIKLFRYGK